MGVLKLAMGLISLSALWRVVVALSRRSAKSRARVVRKGHGGLPSSTADEVSIISWNILADIYADRSKASRT